ncbi:hypothetical protein M758_UG130000 [Ceratodon purpureus]|nr:hypothetical protein M758_UG130000 [Ceratodon purpureus]
MKTSSKNPSSAEMERKKSSRLSAMENSQAETNRRLEDVMKSNMDVMRSNMDVMRSNMDLQSMHQTV